jgi:hypothetical protein
LLDSYGLNTTVTVDNGAETAFDYTQNNCMGIETTYDSYLQYSPAPLADIRQQLIDMNSDLAC